jgi:hypothetical protein
METKQLNLYQKMLAIQSELPTISKNLEVELNKSSKYKAVGEIDVLNAVKPLELKYGVYSYPENREIVESKETTTKDGTVNQFMRIKVWYRFVNVDKPEESLLVVSIADGVDPQDKAPGKAMTYADKYALLKAYKAATGEDPDQDASEEHVSNKASKGQIELINTLYDEETIKTKILPFYKVKALKDLTQEQVTQIIKNAEKKK